MTDLTRDGSSAIAMNANWHGACVLAEVAAQVGDREAAALLYTVLEPHAHLFPLLARAAACLGSAEYFVGRLAWTLGRHEEAEARLRRAVSANDEAGAASRAAVAQLSLGELLADRGDRSGARDALEQAAARAEALGMPAWPPGPSLERLDDRGHPLPDPDAHRRHAVAPAAAAQLVGQSADQARA